MLDGWSRCEEWPKKLDIRDSWYVRDEICGHTPQHRLVSTHSRLLTIDLVIVWKNVHSDVDLGLESLFEVARDVGTRGHRLSSQYRCTDQRLEGGPL